MNVVVFVLMRITCMMLGHAWIYDDDNAYKKCSACGIRRKFRENSS